MSRRTRPARRACRINASWRQFPSLRVRVAGSESRQRSRLLVVQILKRKAFGTRRTGHVRTGRSDGRIVNHRFGDGVAEPKPQYDLAREKSAVMPNAVPLAC